MSCGRIAALVVEAARWALLTESLRWAARGHDFLRTWTRAAQDLPKDEFRHGIHSLKQKECMLSKLLTSLVILDTVKVFYH